MFALVNHFGLSNKAIALHDGVKDVDINSDAIRALEIPACDFLDQADTWYPLASKTDVQVGVRGVKHRLRNTRGRRVFRIRQPRHRSRVRIRDPFSDPRALVLRQALSCSFGSILMAG